MSPTFWESFLATRVLNKLKSSSPVFYFPSPFFLPAVAKVWWIKVVTQAVGLLGAGNLLHPQKGKVSDASHYWPLKIYSQNAVCLTCIISIRENSGHLGPQLCTVEESSCIDLHLRGNPAKMWCRTLFLPSLYYSEVCFLMHIRKTVMTSCFFYTEGICDNQNDFFWG